MTTPHVLILALICAPLLCALACAARHWADRIVQHEREVRRCDGRLVSRARRRWTHDCTPSTTPRTHIRNAERRRIAASLSHRTTTEN